MYRSGSVLQTYWWRGVPNFGDALAPLLIKRFVDKDSEWTPAKNASLISIGSILEHIPSAWNGYILGSGKLRPESKIDLSAATILALRGPLSARGVKGSFAVGDPGLLAPDLVGYQEKKYDLGIFPHWKDHDLVPRFQKIIRPPHSVIVIKPAEDPLTTLRQIGSCRRIVTSSLHGMIVADAFGIPRRVEMCDKLAKEGGDFKFRDYSASIRTPFEVGKMVEPSRRFVEDAMFSIFDAYKLLERELWTY